MPAVRHWVAVVPEQTYLEERLYAHDSLVLPGPVGEPAPSTGDPVVLVAPAGDRPVLFGLAEARVAGPRLTIAYTLRLLDDPVPVHLGATVGVTEISAAEFGGLAALAGNRPARTEWFVTLALPIEATGAGEAVREFWSHVGDLGPRELPAFVWPRGDELAMQAFVLGQAANQDPEEDD